MNWRAILILGAGMMPAAAAANPFLEIREEHWEEAMLIGGLSSELLYGIALAESGNSFNGMRGYGPWPWTLNVNREPKFFSSRAAARRHLEEEVAEGNDRIAVGIWQIYLRWNGHLVDDPLDLLDPVTNLYAAAAVLQDCGRRFNGAREILSCYHAGSVREVGLAYADRVIRLAERWGEPFTMPARPEGVRYTLADAMNDTAEEDAYRPRNESSETGMADSRRTENAPRVLSLSAATRASSHSEFLARMDKRKAEWAVRVVVIE